MRARVLAAAVAAVLPVGVTPAPADAGGAVRAGSARAAVVPCPKLPAPKVTRPPRPVPPPAVPAQQAVGGEALATTGLTVPPGAPTPPPVTATSWLVADLDTGAVLGGCGPHEYGTPASVQKLLLAATMLSKLDPKQVVTVTRPDLDIEPGSSAVGLLDRGRYSVETAWLGLLLQSGNDAANLLARLGAGSAAAGVREMNAEARRLGAWQTRAVTPSGLDGPGQFTSAYDLALIARVCFADPTFRRYALTERAQIPAQPALRKPGFQIQNENQLIYRYPGALGGKTGFTDLARHTYVGAAERGGRRLVVTLLGAEARPVRGWEQGARLLDWGFGLPRDAAVGRLVDPGEVTTPSATPWASAPVAAAPNPAGRVVGAPDWRGGALVGGAAVLVGLLAVLLAVGRRRRARRRVRRRVAWD
ncbi:D-alanyl-D-alanine carboxypeptidase (penicillin-binding protein 5/6) [Micromonospora matsumotoense]|uniref:D-alanyl-D-alanine carboxypeptidase (Penicillin-binding protein 5/6) n=1 Tax=Micromonospora matsumotoense TaxID=121616 RepID=A0A1C5ATB3_9ACTN|nr:serine hydrolase [Micromonospora matsumotoense]SCF48449.1 D-alanyl-D-alanine carboxypeptidase (penicillin-binding protein 5/6) [Micromonospora matsumotoense]